MRSAAHCSRALIVCLIAVTLPVSGVWAYNPPVDTAGPLQVRIEGPDKVEQTDTPYPVRVVLENQGSRIVEGELRLRLIDRWHSNPGDAVFFRIAAGGSQTLVFQVTAGEGTFAAHYPIHALARFEWEGRTLVAHPILILESQIVAESVDRDLAWRPFAISGNGELALCRLNVHRVGLQVFGQAARLMPIGWTGSEPQTRTTVAVGTKQQLGDTTREVISIHPPWSEGRVGTGWIEYPLELPAEQPILLRFSNAVTATGTGDGVTFRVRVARFDVSEDELGEVVFDRHSADKEWLAGEVDLSRFAGQTIRLQLESHPGPKSNTAFDQSYWAEPILVVGKPSVDRPFPPRNSDDAFSLGALSNGDRHTDVRVWPGQRGLLDADVGLLDDDTQLYFRGFRVEVMGQRLDDPKSTMSLIDVQYEDLPVSRLARHRFSSPDGPFDLVVEISRRTSSTTAEAAGYLDISFRLENTPHCKAWFAPRIESVSIDQFSAPVARVYAGHGNVIQQPGPFSLRFDGHRLATSHVGFDFTGGPSLVQAVDLPPSSLEMDPTAMHYSLHAAGEATISLFPAATVWDAARNYRQACSWKAASGVPQLAGRFVFDLWGGRFGQSQQQLRRSFRYGLTDAAVVWHNWQRWGYDYRLPEIYPPNPKLGTESELVSMIDTCREAGVLFALHDNYIDLYPDAEGFSYEQNIAFSGNRRPVRAWINRGREAQSYRYRADQVEQFLKNNLNRIKEKLGPTAYFIDVWSSAPPYDYWTSDGQFFDSRYTRDSWRSHFAWIRDLLGNNAPQISESGHDQLIGWLDGAQTNHLRVDRPVPDHYYSWSVWDIRCDDAERVPWFDFAHHDRFILHGAGYSGRYQAGLDARLHGIYSDDYIATEVLTGHPAMVSSPFGRDVVRKYWLTHDIMRALALRRIKQVTFVDDDLHHQYVQWSNGGHVWVNRGQSDWEVKGYVLPPYGFLALVDTDRGQVSAAICRREHAIVEIAMAEDSLYVNGRQIVGGPLRINGEVSSLEWTSPGRIKMNVDWQADDPIPAGHFPFLHWVGADGEIAFQASYDQAVLVNRSGRISMPARATVPADAKVGDHWELRVGLYSPGSGGQRLAIQGQDDGERRVILGSVELTGRDGKITGVDWKPQETSRDPFLARNNPRAEPVDFGSVVTAGGCRLVRERDAVLLIPLPDSDTVQTEFTVRWDQLGWFTEPPVRIELISEDGRVLRTTPVGKSLTVRADEAIFAYRLCARSENSQ